jgi:hypothetical protein
MQVTERDAYPASAGDLDEDAVPRALPNVLPW